MPRQFAEHNSNRRGRMQTKKTVHSVSKAPGHDLGVMARNVEWVSSLARYETRSWLG